jgi:hypothetical protein
VVTPWFSSPLRLAYVHVVEEATKAFRSLSTLSSFSSQESNLLRRGVISLDDWGDYKPPGAATQVGSSTGNA